jgi:riboflavin synthase
MVQGHVDGTAQFLALQPLPAGNWWLTVRIPSELDRYLIPKGSVTLDGVSLTIAALNDTVAGVAIIPHTYENTVMREYRAGAAVNVEVDVIGKYIEKLLASR